MAKFSRIEVALKMFETGLIPIFYSPDVEVCKKVIKACYLGGIRVFEFTNRGDFAHETFSELSKWVLEEPHLCIFNLEPILLYHLFWLKIWPRYATGEKYCGRLAADHSRKYQKLKN